MNREQVRNRLRCESGMESVQAVLILAVAALILMGMQQLWSPSSGAGVQGSVEDIVIATIAGEEIEGSGFGSSGSGTTGPPSTGGSGGTQEPPVTEPPTNEPPEEPPLESRSFQEVYIAYLSDETKRFANATVQAAKDELATSLDDLTWFDPELAQKTDIILKENMVELAGALFDGTMATSGLVDAKRDIDQLANAGRYNEAWNKIWSAPAKFSIEVFLASKPVSKVLDSLLGLVSVAIQVGVPNAVE
ncbi:MAG: hypothetical protein AB8G99_10510 [Planctomycetaceae bacterium]